MIKLSMKEGLVHAYIDFRVRFQFNTPAITPQQEEARKQIQIKVNKEIDAFEVYCSEEMVKMPIPDQAVSSSKKNEETEKTLDRISQLDEGGNYLALDYESYERLLDSIRRKSLEDIHKLETYRGMEILKVDKQYPFVKSLI